MYGALGYDHRNVFAQIVRHEIPAIRVYEHPLAICFKNTAPAAPTHLLLIPTGPYTDIGSFGANASEDEISALLDGLNYVTQGMEYSIAANSAQGPLTCQEIYHFHLHITSPPLVQPTPPPNGRRQNVEGEAVYFHASEQRLWFGSLGRPWLSQHVRLIAHLARSVLGITQGFNVQGANGVWQMDWT